MYMNGYWKPSEIHNLHQRIIDKKISPYEAGIGYKELEKISEMVKREMKNKAGGYTLNSEELDIYAEQLLEEACIKDKFPSHKRYVKPFPILHIYHDDECSIEGIVYLPGRRAEGKTYSVTYRGSYSDEFRANALAWMQGFLEAARENPILFFAENEE